MSFSFIFISKSQEEISQEEELRRKKEKKKRTNMLNCKGEGEERSCETVKERKFQVMYRMIMNVKWMNRLFQSIRL